MRWAIALAGLLLSGCLASQPAPAEDLPHEGVLATATRVLAVTTPFDRQGQFQDRPCVLQPTFPCTSAVGLASDPWERNVTVPRALFWRVNLTLDWSSQDPRPANLSIVLTALSCQDDVCKAARPLGYVNGTTSPLKFQPDDLFPQGPENGLQVLVRTAPANAQPLVGPLAVDYRLSGAVAGYVPAKPVDGHVN